MVSVTERRIVVFELGGVLIDWNPHHLNRTLFDSDGELVGFLATVRTRAWNRQQDAGRPIAEAVRRMVAAFEGRAHLVYGDRQAGVPERKSA